MPSLEYILAVIVLAAGGIPKGEWLPIPKVVFIAERRLPTHSLTGDQATTKAAFLPP